MNRTQRTSVAKETVEIVERGTYVSPNGSTIDLREAIRSSLDRTKFFSPDDLERLRQEVLAAPVDPIETRIEVVNETTLAGVTRLLTSSSSVPIALNFASAKNPGGGFLTGSQAQEESLARSSALYASQQRAWTFYERHRASSSMLYSDAMIASFECPVFRNDDGSLLDVPYMASFITSPAPNAGAAADHRPDELSAIPEVFRRRSEYVLALAAAHGYKQIVLGAWGCGVFRNDPHVVASSFAHHLRGAWSGRFERVVFSVLDNSPALQTFAAFRDAFQ